MRKDIEGWEQYQAVLDKIIAAAIRWQGHHNHPRMPWVSLLTAAEMQATELGPRALALQYGEVNNAALPLLVADGTALQDATKDFGPRGVLVFLASRAMVIDARVDPKWVAYEKEHEGTWTRPTPCE